MRYPLISVPARNTAPRLDRGDRIRQSLATMPRSALLSTRMASRTKSALLGAALLCALGARPRWG